jgi:hypothetical protein
MDEVRPSQSLLTNTNSLNSESANDEILNEMHRQLKAASRIVLNLKSKVEELSKQNALLSESEQKLAAKIDHLVKNEIERQEMWNQKSESLMQEILTLKKETNRLQEQELALKSKLQAYENPDGVPDFVDANKKVRLAQDQMAKVIARHRREQKEWMARSETLESKVLLCKVNPFPERR